MLSVNAEARQAYAQLMRIDKPVGSYLLLWPTFWVLLLAAETWPSWQHLLVFTLGVFIMRSAGCVINDFADRHIDGRVKRTLNRPLATGAVTPREALALFGVLVSLAFSLVLTLNWQTVLLSFGALAITILYPFMKRYTHLPQLVLGAAFSWGLPMAAMAQLATIPGWVWYFYLANVLWTLAYDTIYAMVDRDDDLLIGVKSSAILFASYDKVVIGCLQIATLVCLSAGGVATAMSWPYWLGLLVMALQFGYHQYLIAPRERAACFRAFRLNHWAGLSVLLGIVASKLLLS